MKAKLALLAALLTMLVAVTPALGAEEIYDPAGCDYTPCEAPWGAGPYDDYPIAN